MSNFGGRLGQPKKMKLILWISFFCQHNSTGGGFLILKQIIVYFICRWSVEIITLSAARQLVSRHGNEVTL
jgi:hypothetical protein